MHDRASFKDSARRNNRLNPDSPLPAPAQYPSEKKSVIRITAKPELVPLVEKIIAAFRRVHPDIPVAATFCHDDAAFAFLINRRSTMALIEREITPTESVPYKKQRGSAPFSVKLAVSPATPAVYVHHSNPLTEISVTQLSQIFTRGNAQGDFSNWGQLLSSSHDASILPLSLPEDSALQVFLQKHLFAGRELTARTEYVLDSATLLARLENMPDGIGIADTAGEHPLLRKVTLTGQARDPLTRFLSLYLPAGEGHDAHRLAGFLLSDDGQTVIAETTCLPLEPAELAQQRAIFAVHS
jgi:phosphate transport system substrate-binding protein